MLIGLVGKPSCGKSTFFKAANLAEIEIASYPFTTIKANHGIGYVKIKCIDKEFKTQCNPTHGFCIEHQRFVPVELMDVAGLVPGASEGKGLGNQFLDELRQADVFIHIVDVSGTTDSEGKPVEDYDPCKDVYFLEEELNKWFYNILMKVWKGFARKAELEDANFAESVARQFSGLKVDEEQVKSVLLKLSFQKKPSIWDEEQLMKFATELRRKSKPMLIVANKIDTKKAKGNYEKLKKEFSDLTIIPCSADSELALKEEKIQETVLDVYDSTGVQEILNFAVFDLLKYLAVFPASANKLADSKGNILPDCFLLPEGSTALDFAFFLHTDFGENFIKAIDARTKRALGKSYVLKNRDALEIITR
jgi:ribosome-binding ATPase YchF (GTP1/OBG family)